MSNDWETERNNISLQALEGKPKGNIEINDKTIKAYQEEFTKKGLVITSKDDYPRDERRMVEKQKKFDSVVDPSKGIMKKIVSMVRQPVHITEKGKRVTKDALCYRGYYEGKNWADIKQGVSFYEGWYLKPIIEFSLVDQNNPFDSQTGKRRGENKVVRNEYEHYIFLPEDKKERRKFLEDILAKYPDSYPEDLGNPSGGHLLFRRASPNNDHHGSRGGSFNWNQFCDLSLSELGECQDKGYYKENSTGILKDKDGVRVEYNKSTGKLEAIK